MILFFNNYQTLLNWTTSIQQRTIIVKK